MPVCFQCSQEAVRRRYNQIVYSDPEFWAQALRKGKSLAGSEMGREGSEVIWGRSPNEDRVRQELQAETSMYPGPESLTCIQVEGRGLMEDEPPSRDDSVGSCYKTD